MKILKKNTKEIIVQEFYSSDLIKAHLVYQIDISDKKCQMSNNSNKQWTEIVKSKLETDKILKLKNTSDVINKTKTWNYLRQSYLIAA